jgi:hypothetical protein
MDEIWASTAAGLYKIAINEDGAESWDSFIPTNSPLETGIIYDIYLDNNYTPWFGTDTGLASWNGTELLTYDDVIGQPVVYDITSDEFGRIWLGTLYSGIIMMDGETTESWTTANSPLPKNHIDYIGCDQKGTVWAHPGVNGLYKLNYENMTGTTTTVATPNILQATNYPNPFNPETTISFNLAEAGQVNVEIFNTKGQKVKTITNQELAAGHHSVVWNGTDNKNDQVGTGIYFYRVKQNDNSVTNKMMLIK